MVPTSGKKPRVSKNLKPAEFSLFAPKAHRVSVAGSFNEWDSSLHSLKQGKKGMWKISIPLAPGQYEYRFLVDGEWQNDPDCSHNVENPLGTTNCLKLVE